jgi:hypothetical protein
VAAAEQEPAPMTSPYVKGITREEHLAHLRLHPDASHLQIPEWADVKPDWTAESVGWFEGEAMVAVALVLYRAFPGTGRFLAYLPDGPAIDWHSQRPERYLDPLIAHLEKEGAFSVRIGPPLVVRHWDAATVAAGVADPSVRHLRDLPTDGIDGYALDAAERLRRLGWRRCKEEDGSGFGLGQPRYGCQIPLAGRSVNELRAALSPNWLRSLQTAEAAGSGSSGVRPTICPRSTACTGPRRNGTASSPAPWTTSGACGRR